MFPYCFQKEPGGDWEGSRDVEGGFDEVHASISTMVFWRKMRSFGDRPGMAPQRLAGTWGSRWGRMRGRRMVQTISTSVTAKTMGRQLSRLAQSLFVRAFYSDFNTVCLLCLSCCLLLV